MDKREIRQMIKQRVSGISPQMRKISSDSIAMLVGFEPEWASASTVLLYSALADEIDCSPLIEDALSKGKKVVLPVVGNDELRLVQYIPGKTTTGAFGIIEPDSTCPEVQVNDIDLAIIPARAYSMIGVRLGRGKGYYDRLMPKLSCPKWGICYTCQLIPDLPMDEWDVPVDRVFF